MAGQPPNWVSWTVTPSVVPALRQGEARPSHFVLVAPWSPLLSPHPARQACTSLSLPSAQECAQSTRHLHPLSLQLCVAPHLPV